MIDFPEMPEVATKASWWFCGLIYIGAFSLYYKNALYIRSQNSKKNFIYLFLLFTFIICPFVAGDFAHYQSFVKIYDGEEFFHLEPVYRYIIIFVKNNYLLFRLICWGGGFAALLLCFKKHHLSIYKTLFIFGIYLISYSYTRTGVALAIYFLGLSFLFSEKRMIDTLIGVVLLLASTQFHTSMYVLVLLTPVIFIPINKRTLPIIIVLVFVLSYFISPLLNAGLDFFSSTSEESAYKIELYAKYSTGASAGNSIFGLIGFYWQKMIVHIPYLICIRYMIKYEKNIPTNIKFVYRLSIALYFFVVVMFLSFGSSSTLYGRYEGMLYIPITIMMSYLYQNNMINKITYKNNVWFCYLYMIWFFGYRMIFA